MSLPLPDWAAAIFWGLVAGGALMLGAIVAYRMRVPARVVAGVMAFGSGVLISALCFELMDEAYHQGGFDSTALGFIGGALIYTLANTFLARRGATNRKRSGAFQPSEADVGGSGAAIAVGALLDGVPESIVIGMSLIHGGTVNIVTLTAVFLSNFPEGLSSADGMKRAGRSPRYIFGVWGGIMLASGLASLAGYLVFSHLSPEINAATTALAAGAILAMLADTMIPEAFEEAHNYAGFITTLGFLTAFVLSKLEG